MKVYYGDGTRLDLLRAAGAAEARALLFCQDGNRLTKARLEPILDAFPQAAVFVRAFDRKHIMDLDGLDLAGIYREVFESDVIMGSAALGRFDLSDEEVLRIERAYRDRDSERLEGQSRSGDLHTLKERMFRPDNPLRDVGTIKLPSATRKRRTSYIAIELSKKAEPSPTGAQQGQRD